MKRSTQKKNDEGVQFKFDIWNSYLALDKKMDIILKLTLMRINATVAIIGREKNKVQRNHPDDE